MSQSVKHSYNRQLILELLESQDNHLSATTVHHQLAIKGHKLALSTTYSNLDALNEAGLIGEVYSTQGERLFERRTELHAHHLLCKACDKVQDLAAGALSEACLRDLEKQAGAAGWQPLPLQLTLVGRCPTCASSQRTSPSET